MAKNISTHLQKELLLQLGRLIEKTAVDDRDIHGRYQSDIEQLQAQFQAANEQLAAAAAAGIEKLDDQYLVELEASRLKLERETAEAEQSRNDTSDDVARHRSDEVKQASDDFDAMIGSIESAFASDKAKAHESHVQFLAKCEAGKQTFEAALSNARAVFLKRRCLVHAEETSVDATQKSSNDHLASFRTSLQTASQLTDRLRRNTGNRFLNEGWGVLLFLFVAIAVALGAWQIAAAPFLFAALLGAGVGLIVAAASMFIVGRQAHSAALAMTPATNASLGQAIGALAAAAAASKLETANLCETLKRQRAENVIKTTNERDTQITEAESRCGKRRNKLELLFMQRIAELEKNWNVETKTIRNHYGPLIETTKQNEQRKADELKKTLELKLEERNSEFNDQIQSLCTRWSNELGEFQRQSHGLSDFCEANFPKLAEVDWTNWKSSGDSLHAVRFGEYSIAATTVASEIPKSDELIACPESFSMPAMLTFPELPSLVLNAESDGRAAAIDVMQNTMLRLLTSLPPGKVRFTIVDPIGLGQNFSAFMHLADFDERMVTSRIWTETAHINQRLGDLTEHMENVIQKYLRNEFESIHEYNEHAGEVAEPFHILVVANFPANFSDEVARRLVSIVNSGPKCGVYTLLSRDTRLALPRSFNPSDIERHANTLEWQGDRFVWQDEQMRACDVSLDEPPNDEVVTSILKAIGREAADSKRVEVPFASVVPAKEDFWTSSCSSELSVALGRSGATRFQNINLGVGTSQHVLISGKTGSGKSTLLHALITNAALHYSPDEVEFYLIDFKKGVEFKPYADFKLPHARVIAIESEREFGMSVLQRLDQELRERGDLFRDAGVQSLKAFREAKPDVRMPRVLFIVDEFQEFFVNDDKIAHDASLLLDRLVRQGRAFGMHVILGSQTLAGAYSLARSTIGQMAIRVALQCSAADAHLILSEDNTAARLLSRPGEAIYNDANGMFEGNNLFQVVWLTDAEREKHLGQLSRLAEQHRIDTPPPIIFEGNATADPRTNDQLLESLESLPESSLVAADAWLGSAIAIKPPTSATFKRQHGCNFLVVGQRPELASGMLTNAIVSLASARSVRADDPTSRCVRFAVLDGGRAETDSTEFGDRLAATLPIDIAVYGPNKAANAIQEIADELTRRNESDEHAFEPFYLVIHDIARFRDLQPNDDFGFGGFGDDKPTDAAALLASILKDGPVVGIHTMVWADSYNNVNRWFVRQTLRDFGMRALFQMSAVDSSNLMDSAAASHLSQHRAIFYSDERGESEKFRPYGVADDSWLQHVADLMKNATANRSRSV